MTSTQNPNPEAYWFADHLQTARQSAGLTVTALSERSGISRPAIHEYLSARRQPTINQARTLLQACNHTLGVQPNTGAETVMGADHR